MELYGLDHFLDHFLDYFFWTILKGGSTPLVLREGRMKSISTKRGVGGGVLLLREGCETDNYYAGRGERWL